METSSESLRIISRASVIGCGGVGWTESALWDKQAVLIQKWSTFCVFLMCSLRRLQEKLRAVSWALSMFPSSLANYHTHTHPHSKYKGRIGTIKSSSLKSYRKQNTNTSILLLLVYHGMLVRDSGTGSKVVEVMVCCRKWKKQQ